jgi:hypothetical protein
MFDGTALGSPGGNAVTPQPLPANRDLCVAPASGIQIIDSASIHRTVMRAATPGWGGAI